MFMGVAHPEHCLNTPKLAADFLFSSFQSFNLKPAVAARPNIQGPRTNLKVAAILEKASTIRQVCPCSKNVCRIIVLQSGPSIFQSSSTVKLTNFETGNGWK